MSLTGALQSFFRYNRSICEKIEDRLPQAMTLSFNRLYEATVREAMNDSPGKVVVDIGGGKKCFVSEFRNSNLDTRIYAFDISESELRLNTGVDGKVVSDVTAALPLAGKSVDLMTSRSLMEHLSDTGAFMAHAYGVLKRGGYFIHLCPGKFTPFALINQILPPSIARRILYFFHPNFADECGFRAFYNKTYYSGVKRNLENAGFRVVEIRTRYYQSIYYTFFVPLYLTVLLYDWIVYALGIRNLAAQLLIVATKD